MRIASGVTDQYLYFVAVDSTDLKTRETGLTTFTVYRSRNGAAAAAYTTPTVNETDTTNMPGVYELLLDEDMTIGAGNETEEVCLHITQASMAPVTRTFELYRPKITAGNTLDVTATGAAGIDWGNVENKTTANDLSGTDIQLADTVTTLTGHTAQTGDNYARIGAPAGASVSADIAAIEAQTDDIGVAGAGLTAVPWNAAWDAEVQSECADALTAYGPNTTTPPTAGAVADAVWDEAQADHVAAGSFGLIASEIETIDTVVDGIQTDLDNGTDGLGAIKAETALIVADTNELQTDDVPGLIAALNDLSAAQVNAECDTALTDYDGLVAGDIPAALLDLANGVETGVTVREALRAMSAVLAGEASGGPGSSAFKAIANSGTTRVTSTADTDGDRSAVVLNL